MLNDNNVYNLQVHRLSLLELGNTNEHLLGCCSDRRTNSESKKDIVTSRNSRDSPMGSSIVLLSSESLSLHLNYEAVPEYNAGEEAMPQRMSFRHMCH